MFRIYSWIHRGSLGFFILLAVCFAAVLPIDSIAQASASQNDALNTFIVVGALVAFAIICITIVIARIVYYKSCIIDIPRRYLPITEDDLPHNPSRNYLLSNMDKSHELSILFKQPNESIIHDGLEPPKRCDIPLREKVFPEYLNYENCMKIVSNRIKYQGFFLAIVDVNLKLEETFTDIITQQFIVSNNNKIQVEKAEKFIEIYEFLQFSGKPINRNLFTEFVELCIYFADIISTTDKSRSLHLTKTKSNASLKSKKSHKHSKRKTGIDSKNNSYHYKDLENKDLNLTTPEFNQTGFSQNLSANKISDSHYTSSDYTPEDLDYFPKETTDNLDPNISTPGNDTQEFSASVLSQPQVPNRKSLANSNSTTTTAPTNIMNDVESKVSTQRSLKSVIIHR